MIYKEFVLKITAKHVYKSWKIYTIVSHKNNLFAFWGEGGLRKITTHAIMLKILLKCKI